MLPCCWAQLEAAGGWLLGAWRAEALRSLPFHPSLQSMSAADFKRLSERPEHQPPKKGGCSNSWS